MRKTRKAAAVLTAVAMAAVSAVPAMADEIKDLYDYELQAREIETWNVLYSQQATDLQVLTNLYDGLLESDEYGSWYRQSQRAGRQRTTVLLGHSI